MAGFLSLTQIVHSYISQWEKPESSFRRLYSTGLRGYKFCELHGSGTPKTVTLEVLSNKTAILPDNCLSVLNIGFLNASGELINIKRNEELTLSKSTATDRTEQKTECESVEETGYRIDYDNSRIVLPFDFRYDELVAEYLPVFEETNEDLIIADQFEETLIEWIGWKDKTQSPQDRANHERLFWNHFRIAKRSMKPFNIRESYKYFSIGKTGSYPSGKMPATQSGGQSSNNSLPFILA